MRYKTIISFFIMVIVAANSLAHAALIHQKVMADQHVKMVNYDTNNVVIIHGHYGYQTQIVFAANEVVQNVSIGDSLAWQAVPFK